jgi:hypothetical protein
MKGFLAALVFALVTIAPGQTQTGYSSAPPGSVVQTKTVYLSGEGMNSAWHAVLSRKLMGTGDTGTKFYQYYLSIYHPSGKLKYRSPGNGGPLSTLAKATGANLWFPLQQIKIVGTGEFMEAAVQQLVVQSHEFAADCGAAIVSVFAYDSASQKVVPSASISNGCSLTAAIVSPGNASSLKLTGPYYGPNAAMCCPTKPNASAVVRYTNGTWNEKPNYYALKIGGFNQ